VDELQLQLRHAVQRRHHVRRQRILILRAPTQVVAVGTGQLPDN
jgi:hypothetical protein